MHLGRRDGPIWVKPEDRVYSLAFRHASNFVDLPSGRKASSVLPELLGVETKLKTVLNQIKWGKKSDRDEPKEKSLSFAMTAIGTG